MRHSSTIDELNPTARALRCLELISDQPGITARALGQRLGISERAVRRYVEILRAAGITIESMRGRYGGYRVGRGLRLPPLTFSSSEALGLVMAVLDGHHAADDPADPVGSALGKIMRALPTAVAAQADKVRRTTAPAPDHAAARPDPMITSELVRASADRRRVKIDYQSEAGSEWIMEVDPWAVVVRRGRWYLLCWSIRSAAQRAYRIDRVRGVELLDDRFAPPDDLDPVALLEAHLAVGWEYEVEVIIDAPLDDVRRHLDGALGRLEAIEPGRTLLIGSTSNPWWYAEQLARTRAAFMIVRGPELQHAVRALGARLLAAAPSQSNEPPLGSARQSLDLDRNP